MREYKTVSVPATTRRECVRRVCDLCGREGRPDRWSGHSTYTIDDTEVCVTVRHEDGARYPEGGSGTETVIDLCPTCFQKRLVPWLRAQGAQIKPVEWDY